MNRLREWIEKHREVDSYEAAQMRATVFIGGIILACFTAGKKAPFFALVKYSIAMMFPTMFVCAIGYMITHYSAKKDDHPDAWEMRKTALCVAAVIFIIYYTIVK